MGMMIEPSDVAFCVDENNWRIHRGDGTTTPLRALTVYELANGYYNGGSQLTGFREAS
jgi:hypothetical protein